MQARSAGAQWSWSPDGGAAAREGLLLLLLLQAEALFQQDGWRMDLCTCEETSEHAGRMDAKVDPSPETVAAWSP